MQRLRRAVVLLPAISVLGGASLFFSILLYRKTPSGPLQPEVPYAVDLQWGQNVVDLEFDQNTRYLLIVGSLGDAQSEYTVSLDTETVERVEYRPVQILNQPPAAPAGTGPGISNTRRSPHSASRRESHPTQNPRRNHSRHFYLHVTDGALDDPKQYVRVEADVVAVGEHVRVYLDRQHTLSALHPGVADEIVQLLEQQVMPRLEAVFGRTRDVDDDGYFTVLLTPWLGRLQGGQTSLGGFVRATDFGGRLAPPFSNQCDMLYLNSDVRPGRHLQTLLAHEMTHAVCFSRRATDANVAVEDDWLNEAIAHLGENLDGTSWTNLNYRISRFLNDPERYPLVVRDYYGAGMWRNHGCRGATYLFLRWCVDQFGVEILSRMVDTTQSGVSNLEAATGMPFDELFRRWSIAVWQSGRHAPNAEGPGVCYAADSHRSGGLTSLDLYAPLDDWGLAGPRSHCWDVAEGSQHLNVRGTSSAYVVMHSSRPGQTRRVRFHAPFGAQLQVTLMKIAPDWPVVQADAEWEAISPAAFTPGRFADPAEEILACHIRTGRDDWTVEAIACERNYEEVRSTNCFTGENLNNCRSFPQLYLSGDGVASFALPVQPREDAPEPLIVKVVVRDRLGRRAVTRIAIPDRSSHPVQFAEAGWSESR